MELLPGTTSKPGVWLPTRSRTYPRNRANKFAVIRCTRRNMPATRVLPRPGRIEVRYGSPIAPAAATTLEDPALLLRDASRAAILAQLGEPDLCERATGTDG